MSTVNRTYHLQAEDDADRVAWMSVLMNCKEGALQKVFDDTGRPTDEVRPRTAEHGSVGTTHGAGNTTETLNKRFVPHPPNY